MPFFDILCAEHGKQETFSRDPAKLECPFCKKSVKRLWSQPASFRVDFTPGWDPGFGQNIATKRERDNKLVEQNLRRIKD